MILRSLRRGSRAATSGADHVDLAEPVDDEPADVPAAAPSPAPSPAIGRIEPAPAVARLIARADELAAGGDPFAAIELLTDANRAERDPFVEFRLIHLRHEAFSRLEVGDGRASWPPVVPDRFAEVDGCPTIEASELDSDVLASAVTNHGCLLVRGLFDEEAVERMRRDIDEAFEASHAKVYASVGTKAGSWYQPFRPDPNDPPPLLGHRWWVQEAGGVLAADSPPAFFTMAEVFEDVGVRDVIAGYLGERPVLSVDKCTLRRVPLDLTPPDWHQDGRFLGEGIRVMNLWVALSPCGGDISSPGLDLVPKRFDTILETGTRGAYMDWAVGHDLVLDESVDAPIIRPEFGAGDALLFDELFLHRTAFDPSMDTERYAIECWFFAPSAYPDGAIPIVI